MIGAVGGLRSPWRALANRNFRLYFAGQLISQSGTWMQRIGQAWLVLDLTGSPLALGSLTVLQFAPILVLSLFSGAIADRFSRRWLVFGLQAAAMAQALVLAGLVLSHTVQLWHVYALAMALGTITAFDNPSRQAFVSEMVSRDEVQSAVGMNSSVFNAARIFGPGLGGIVIATAGVGWCFLLNGLSYVAVLAALLAMRADLLHPQPRALPGRVPRQVWDGVRYAAREPAIAIPLVIALFVGTFGYNWGVVLPLLARYAFDVGPVGFGGLQVALGVGSLFGALAIASRAEPTTRLLALAALAFGTLLLGVAASPIYAIALTFLLGLGAIGVTSTAGTNAALQLRSEPSYRARVLSLYFLVSSGTTPFGGALTGAMADAFGVRAALALNAALVLVGGAIGLLAMRRGRARTERAETEPLVPSSSK